VTQAYETLTESGLRSAYDAAIERSRKFSGSQRSKAADAINTTAFDFAESADDEFQEAGQCFKEGITALQTGQLALAVKRLGAAARLSLEGIRCRIVDLRWLAPLPAEDILREARATGRVLIADETRRTAGVSEGVLSILADDRFGGWVRRVTSEDSFVPLGDAADAVLLSQQDIETAAREFMR